MSYINVYPARIDWENEPSINTPINALNLNKMDYALYSIDQTLANWDTTKANQSDLLLSVKSIDYDTSTGVFVFTWQNGTTKTIDLNIEKIPVSFSMDANGVITMTTEDGTTYTADVGALIKTYTFTDSSVIDFTVTTDASGNKTVTADIVDGSITGQKLQPNYLADCQTAETNAGNSATAAASSKGDAEAWAVGTRGGVPVPSTDPAYENNAYYWAQHGGNSFAGLSDVDMAGVQNGDVFIFDASDSKLKPGNVSIDIDTETPTFTEASTRANIASGETISTLFGKIKKWFSDINTKDAADIGKIEAFMRTTAPTGYLKCDGATYYIANYPLLTNMFLAEFGSKNFFGGNGTTTFAVPDLRGEFLRGTGTNSHTNQGSGANVGTHQDGTAHINLYVSNTAGLSYYPDKGNNPLDSSYYADAYGSYECTSSAYLTTGAYARYPLQTPVKSTFRSRPTNTSVLYCIRAY